MESRVRLLILCLVCVARASKVLPEEITELRAGSLGYKDIEDLSRTPVRKTDGIDGQIMDKSRDKRALGLLLSGLAQIFGYTVTPVQLASLPNPNTTRPAAMSNSTMMGNVTGPHTAASRPANATVPRQQETIRFTGVVNFGNNSDIIGHLQRYEQIFHGRRNNTMATTMTSTRPTPMPPAKISVDPRTNLRDLQDRPPLLAPFFVKIPLPIAPELLPATVPDEDFKLSYPDSPISLVSESNEEEETPVHKSPVSESSEDEETPVRKEQETIYRKNEDTERYTVEEKDIYDEKDVRKPTSKYNHQLYIDEPARKKQQEERYNKLQREQEEHVERLKEQEERRNHDKNTRYREDEINEKHRNREEEIANRNREYTSKYEPTEEKRPVYDDVEDEDSAENERTSANLSSESSKQPPRKKEKEEVEDYSNYDDDDKQSSGYKQPENFDKYIVGYNQQLPIGDYFHENNPEVIRDSYGEILNNKNLEDDRLASYVNMFKHPYVTNVYDSKKVQNPEDASREDEKGTITDSYDEHLARLQKLKEEYALPENKYEEYDINDEREADRNDRKSEKIRNRTSGKSKRPKTGHLHGKEEDRARTPIGSNGNEVLRKDDVRFENTKSQEEVDFARYMPLVVPIRYIDTSDKMQQATIQQPNYKKSDESTNNRFLENHTRTVPVEQLTSQIGLPEKPRQLHEGEHKNLQIWPSPFDYAFDNTEPVNTIIPNPQNYDPNYYQHVKNIAANDANNNNPSEQPSGYLVVVGNPVYPYRYPYNIYYFPNEAANSGNQGPRLNAEGTHPRDQIYASQQNANQQFIQINPNLTEYNLNKTAKGLHNYYYQPQEVPPNALNRYRYIFEEHTLQPKELLNIDVKSQIPDTENWSSKIYPLQSRGKTVKQSPPILAQVQNVASSNQKVQSRPSERPHYPQQLRKRKSSRSEEQRKNDSNVKTPQPTLKNKPFDDPQSAHDFFGFSKDDYNFGGESSDASKVDEENGTTAKESDVFVAPEPIAYHHDDESTMKHTDEPENDTEKAKVKEYRNKVATLRVSEQRQLKPNGPIHYVDYEKREEIQRRNELENRMAEILENLKTRLLVE